MNSRNMLSISQSILVAVLPSIFLTANAVEFVPTSGQLPFRSEFSVSHDYYQNSISILQSAMDRDRAYLHANPNDESEYQLTLLDQHEASLNRIIRIYTNKDSINNHLAGTRPDKWKNEYFDNTWRDKLEAKAQTEMIYIAHELNSLMRSYRDLQKAQIYRQ